MSGPDYLLAIDQGTTSTRAILFDAFGAVRHTARRELRQIYPRPGWVEHDPEEIWQAGRLAAVKSTTDDNGTRLQVSGRAADGGFRVIGEDGPFLAPAQLLTSNMLWDIRMLSATRLIDVQYGGVIGLAVKPLGEALVDTPNGQVRASRHHLIPPHYTGTLFHDSDGRWVKALIEARGEIIEYALAI